MPTPLHIEKSKNNPEVILNKETGIFKISGRSIVEDPKGFYTPVYKWIEEYITAPLKETDFVFDLEYFNSSSARQVMEIIMLLEKIPDTGNKIKISWMYEEGDEMSKDRGSEIELVSKLDFDIKEYPAEDI